MRKMPLNQIAFGKTDAFNELNTFGQEYFMESFVANPKYHIDDFLSGSRFFVCGKKGTGKSALLKYLECHFLKDESNLVFPIRFKSEIEQVDKDSFEEIASAPDNSTKNEKYDTSSILDQSSYVLVWKTFFKLIFIPNRQFEFVYQHIYWRVNKFKLRKNLIYFF